MREAILREALVIMSADGIEGVTLRGLADRLEYSAAALYRYFSSRDEIIGALALESLGLLGDRVASAVDGAVGDRLIAAGEAYLAFASEEPARFRLLFVEQRSSRSSLEDPPGARSPYRVVLELAAEAIAQGEIAEDLDAESVAFTLWSLVHGMAVLESTHLRGFEADFSSVHRQALEHLVRGWKK